VVAKALSCLPQYEAFVSGLIGLDHILYFVLMSVLFLWLTQVGLRRIQY
jgi:hypothetical protein